MSPRLVTCSTISTGEPTSPPRTPSDSPIGRISRRTSLPAQPTPLPRLLRRRRRVSARPQRSHRRYRPRPRTQATPLWEALRDLAAGRTVTDQLGGDCLFRPTRDRYANKTALIIDSNNNWRRRVWYAARTAAKLDADSSLSTLDPRPRAIKVKDLRAYAASVVVDSGGTQYEAAALLTQNHRPRQRTTMCLKRHIWR